MPMKRESLLIREKDNLDWVNVTNPTKEELEALATEYNWSRSSVEDFFEVDHFPKYETFDNYTFVILRFYNDESQEDMDTIRSISSKLAIFISKDYVVTISRKDFPQISDVQQKHGHKAYDRLDTLFLLTSLTLACLQSYELPSKLLSERLDHYEEQVFLHNRHKPILKSAYYIKRKVDTVRRLLILLYEVVDKIDATEQSNASTRDLRDYFTKIRNIFDNISENTSQLLSVSFSAAAHRTNETMRILTIFSVFFMPLTFIVGIYGMNFEIMPELKWKYGYPAAMLVMLSIVVCIYIWFKRKRWL